MKKLAIILAIVVLISSTGIGVLISQNNQSNMKNKALEIKLAEAQETLNTVSSEAQTKADNLTSQIEILTTQWETAKAEALKADADAKAKADELNLKIETLTTKLETAKAEALKADVNAMVKAAELTSQIETLTTQLESAKAEALKADADATAKEAELTLQIETLIVQLETAKAEALKADADATAKAAELTSQIGTLTTQLETARVFSSKIEADAKTMADKLTSQVESMTAQLGTAKMNAIQAELDAKAIVDDLTSQVETLSEQLEAAKAEAKKVEAEAKVKADGLLTQVQAQAARSHTPAQMKIIETAYYGNMEISGFTRKTPINMQGDKLYTYYPGGIFTFRGDGMRQNAAFGTADMPLERLSVLWQTELGSLRTFDSGTLYGLGWTGQPAIVKWSAEVRGAMNLTEEKKSVVALKEVIFAAQDGQVYFLDLADGVQTREPINIGYPLKGSVSVDAFGRPLIAFGQANSKLPSKTGDIGYYFYSLIDQTQLHFINGRKTKTQLQYSTNGAFDGTGLFDRQSDSLVIAGENGLLYTVKLNTMFDFRNPTSLAIEPEIIYLRSKGNQEDTTVSIESSVAMYGPYAFIADKHGLIRCVDTTKMKTVWAFDAGDNTDATPALDLEKEDVLALYTATTVFTRSRRTGKALIRRLDALTGEESWRFEITAKYDPSERAGVKSSPVVGQDEIGELVFFTVNMTEEGGAILALDKHNGKQVWKVPLPAGAVSSPVAVYTPDGRARVIQADLSGKLHFINGLTGQVIDVLDLGGTIEGSPAVYNDVLVIGTSDRDNNRMYGIRIE